ncbi:BT_3987 domain-containing protein [Sphingobacterium griseoflavum]|uniref:F5/8 type C domain-containing protein n=1 Tax=Sphingobacterium griseoflavum TaxID=1474952 RepID=A0ABQ3HXQ4_9SPHI|nr:DUF1735 domain-containing protein [Sphingobacterium griseoflavum]GHE36591.1 hypothetical protein GCM10017764_19650 [Sphingobacterium griseoflavum]
MKKRIYIRYRQVCVRLLFATVVLAGIAACTKDVEYQVENEGTIYMAQAYSNVAAVTLYAIDTLQDVHFGASYGGLKYPESDIPVVFEVDAALIDSYNQEFGTNFIAFPQSSYTISGLQSTIRSGRSDSDPLKIAVSAKELSLGVSYMLPVRLVSAGSSPINEALSVSYLRIDSLIRRERDVTAQGTIAVSHENNGGANANEGSLKLVDNNTATKYLTQNYTSGMWFQLTFPTAKALGAYTFTSGNDADTRDPKTWRLEGSNNGTEWTVLDTRTDQVFTSRTQTRRFEFANTDAYTRYRIVVVANNGATLFQMSEWRMIEYY